MLSRTNTPPQSRTYMEDRIVFCANCDENRTLCRSADGLVCAVCASKTWMHLQVRTPATGIPRALAQVSQAIVQRVVELSQPRLAPVIGG